MKGNQSGTLEEKSHASAAVAPRSYGPGAGPRVLSETTGDTRSNGGTSPKWTAGQENEGREEDCMRAEIERDKNVFQKATQHALCSKAPKEER